MKEGMVRAIVAAGMVATLAIGYGIGAAGAGVSEGDGPSRYRIRSGDGPPRLVIRGDYAEDSWSRLRLVDVDWRAGRIVFRAVGADGAR